MSILLYGCTTCTLTEPIETKLDRNCTRMPQAILNKSWKQHPTKQQHGHLQPISKTIQIRHARHCWRSKNELISGVLPRTPSHGRASVGRPARTYLQQLCTDTECSLEDQPEAVDNRDEEREREREREGGRVREIRASSMTRWWWCLLIVLQSRCKIIIEYLGLTIQTKSKCLNQ